MRESDLRRSLALFLQEDRASLDVTSLAVIPPRLRAVGELVAQGKGTVSGMRAAVALASIAHLKAKVLVQDGERIRDGQPLVRLQGNARRLLGIERTLVNLVMHLSGIATETAHVVATARAVRPGFRIAATRKTIPGLRDLEKEAVVHGGGEPHRRDLSDALLLKGSHLRISGFRPSLMRARAYARRHSLPLMVEVGSPQEAVAAARQGASRILLDNLTPAQVRTVIQTLAEEDLRNHVEIEVTGGISPANVAAYARTGADLASSGHLTHSAPALPMHLVVRSERGPSRRPGRS